jgi:hypothetical protein
MIGFWEENPPITTSHPDVKATVYKKAGKSLIAIGNFSDTQQTIFLKIDFEKLGIDPKTATLIAPEIQDFQAAKQWKVGDKITVEPRKGWLIYVGN